MKRIVCDIDDTISFTTSRDWENATPNQEVIDKINTLYDQGWEIYLVTARGSLSCKSREEAEDKYREQIETWMKKHGVKYHELSFQKFLAAYYVDDKSITPEEFVKLDIRQLKAGWSGAVVELRDGRVYKTADNSLDAVAWYDIAQHFFNTPKIYSLIGNTIAMEYVKEIDEALKIDDAISIINKMKRIPYDMEFHSYKNYLNRIKKHSEWIASYVDIHTNVYFNYYAEVLQYMNLHIMRTSDKDIALMDNEISFCHGDLSLENMLCTENGIVLIDPIYEPNKNSWSSWLLDASKLLHSLRKNNRMIEYEYVLKSFVSDNISERTLLILELFQHIRTFKYAPTDVLKSKVLQNSYDVIQKLKL